MRIPHPSPAAVPTHRHLQRRPVSRRAGWTLPEALVATLLVAISFTSLYSGLMQGFNIIRDSGENLRATEIMAEKMETIRLYTWDQLTNTGYVPTSFTNYYYPANLAGGNPGVTYYGTLGITDGPLTESYSNDLKQVVVTVTWSSDSVPHRRQMTTFVSHYGMQNYIYTAK